jgi:hypothetical protein
VKALGNFLRREARTDWITLAFFAAAVMLVSPWAYAQQQGTRVCTTTTSGSISHEYCSFTPLVVQAPAVTVQPAQVSVQPRVVLEPAPVKAPPKPEKKIGE